MKKELHNQAQSIQPKIQSIAMPNRPSRTPAEWQYEIKRRLTHLRLGFH